MRKASSTRKIKVQGSCGCCNGRADAYTRLCVFHSIGPSPRIQHALRTDSLSLDLTKVQAEHLLALASTLQSLEALDRIHLTGSLGSPLGNSIPQSFLSGIVAHIHFNPGLHELHLEKLQFSANIWIRLNEGLVSANALSVLSIVQCNLNDAGLASLCPGLATCTQLKTLNLAKNHLGGEAGFELARVIAKSNQRVDEEQWAAGLRGDVAPAATASFQYLVLQGNKLTTRAVSCLCAGLSHDQSVLLLDLRENGLSDEVCDIVLSLLDSNKTLLMVDLRKNTNCQPLKLGIIYNRLCSNYARSKLTSNRKIRKKLEAMRRSLKINSVRTPRQSVRRNIMCGRCVELEGSLTATQHTCTSLKEENEKLKRKLNQLKHKAR